jgi:predicted MFS family arabinose efflux permease
MFFGYGFVMASSYSRMPGIRDQLGCTPTQLAFALVCMGVGIILGMPFAGRLVDRFSSRAVSLVATLVSLGGWVLVPTARSVPVLALTLLITGVGAGVAGVAINVQGHLVEVRRRKVWMPTGTDFFPLGRCLGRLRALSPPPLGCPSRGSCWACRAFWRLPCA